jgi:branched-subunit amino acid ABC-type transport system permease component
MDDHDRQIEFSPLQTHSRTFELVMLALSIICVIIVLVILLATDIGNEFRPTV